MFRNLFRTRDDLILTFVRLILGLVFLAHGCQKVLGWFGGEGYAQTINYFTQHLGIPEALAGIAVWTEFAGGIALIIGFITRVAALAVGIEMIEAAAMVHVQNGFFMNWFGTQRGEGFEFHLLVLALSATLVAKGAGAFSVDRAVAYPHPVHPHPYPAPSHG